MTLNLLFLFTLAQLKRNTIPEYFGVKRKLQIRKKSRRKKRNLSLPQLTQITIHEYWGEKQKLLRRRIAQSRRGKRRKRTTIDDLPDNVIYEILKKLPLKSFGKFLLAYPRVGSIHGAYTLWMRKKKKHYSLRRGLADWYNRVRREAGGTTWYGLDIKPDYKQFVQRNKIINIRRINKLLKHIQNSINSHYNDLTCRRSIRLKERKDLLDVPFLVVLSDGNVFLRR